ncbi:MAG: helix-turn-helix domain-containing protein [Arenicellales bacterium]
MSTMAHDNDRNDWQLITDLRYENFEEFNEAVHGWDFNFHQLTSGRSKTGLLQIGHPDFLISRFFLEQAYDQRGSLPSGVMTFGIPEAGDNEVITPGGIAQQDDILCIPSGHELVALTQPHFKAHSVSISEKLINEVAESCGLQRIRPVAYPSQKVLRCDPEKTAVLRKKLRSISSSLEQIKKTDSCSAIFRELEFSLIQHLLLMISESRPTDKLKISKIKHARLLRALNYIEANADKPVTVLELAQETGSTVRTLEYIYRDYFNVTPKAFLKSHRMNAVHSELHTALDRKVTIKEIANHWGFWHLSQFAVDYRRFFGELPSETVNKHM